MQEVKNLATTLRDSIAKLKAAHTDAASKLQSEVNHSTANLAKVTSFTTELASANKEVEAMLGDTGSNFPPSDAGSVSAVPTDLNGVTLNK